MYDNYVTRDELAAKDRETANAVWGVGIGLLCVFAPAAVTTGLWWLAGIGLVWLFFASSAFRTFTLFAVGGLFLWLGYSEVDKLWGYGFVGAAVLNSAVAQYRAYGWSVSEWWGDY